MHTPYCRCRKCALRGYRAERTGDFWLRLLHPIEWKWVVARRKTMDARALLREIEG